VGGGRTKIRKISEKRIKMKIERERKRQHEDGKAI
jgi:hypothetical protein